MYEKGAKLNSVLHKRLDPISSNYHATKPSLFMMQNLILQIFTTLYPYVIPQV